MLDPRIKLRHLRTFVDVARRGSVKQAADHLAVTQPAVSKTLKELEDIAGARLMDRSRAGVVLTPIGEMFLHHAGSALASLIQGMDGVAQARSGGEMPLRIGALPSVAARIVPGAVAQLKAAVPDQPVRIVTGPNGYLLDLVRDGELDLVIGRLGGQESMVGLSFGHLYSERVAVVVRPGHPLLDTADMTRIADHTVLFPDPGAAIRDLADQLLVTNGIARLPNRIETVAATFGRTYVRRSDAVWFISYGVVALDLADGLMAELPMAVDQTLGPVGLTMRAEAPMTPAMTRFLGILRRIADAAVG
ncbi:MAG: pca operon transcription factor PcaQ [Alphaproteobacteria bacterium]|jgi:LysR family pca operon transcriptional activator|nr:pca operon transcription factor PcaQ [Alphaproteobacteria bacterium]